MQSWIFVKINNFFSIFLFIYYSQKFVRTNFSLFFQKNTSLAINRLDLTICQALQKRIWHPDKHLWWSFSKNSIIELDRLTSHTSGLRKSLKKAVKKIRTNLFIFHFLINFPINYFLKYVSLLMKYKVLM